MKKFFAAVLMVVCMSLTACGADTGSDAVEDTDDEEVFEVVEETGGTDAGENRILQRPILKEIADDTDDIDKEEVNITENTEDNVDVIEEENTENDTNVTRWDELFEKGDIDLSPYGLSEENKELLKNLCWTVNDFAGPEEMDETFWRIFLRFTYGAGWWREQEGVTISRPNYNKSNTEYVSKVSYEEVETYTQLVFGVEWPGIKPAYEDMPEDEQSFFYEDGFYYNGLFDWLDKQYIITDCIVDENGTIYVTVQHGFNDFDNDIIWETILTLQPADNENGFVLTAKQTERLLYQRDLSNISENNH